MRRLAIALILCVVWCVFSYIRFTHYIDQSVYLKLDCRGENQTNVASKDEPVVVELRTLANWWLRSACIGPIAGGGIIAWMICIAVVRENKDKEKARKGFDVIQ
jgi:hypothetical protein